MLPDYNRVKGIHPGAILKRELKKRRIKSIALAKSIDEYPQTINAITKERRGINPKLSIKLGNFFDVEQDYFMLLQASYEVKNSLDEAKPNALIGTIRKAIFWDTDINNLDLNKNRRFIIQRILERGNTGEIKELIKLYTKSDIQKELEGINNYFHPNTLHNIAALIES